MNEQQPNIKKLIEKKERKKQNWYKFDPVGFPGLILTFDRNLSILISNSCGLSIQPRCGPSVNLTALLQQCEKIASTGSKKKNSLDGTD